VETNVLRPQVSLSPLNHSLPIITALSISAVTSVSFPSSIYLIQRELQFSFLRKRKKKKLLFCQRNPLCPSSGLVTSSETPPNLPLASGFASLLIFTPHFHPPNYTRTIASDYILTLPLDTPSPAITPAPAFDPCEPMRTL
jgi:hypothetical protein